MSATFATRAAPLPADGLLHPAVALSVATLVLNDHVLKQAWPGFLTGKLSDVAGLVFFPLFLQALWELARLRATFRTSRRVLGGCAALTAIGFTFAETTAAGDWLFRWSLGALQWPVRWLSHSEAGIIPVQHVADAQDLLALPAVLVAVAVGWTRSGYSTWKYPRSDT